MTSSFCQIIQRKYNSFSSGVLALASCAHPSSSQYSFSSVVPFFCVCVYSCVVLGSKEQRRIVVRCFAAVSIFAAFVLCQQLSELFIFSTTHLQQTFVMLFIVSFVSILLLSFSFRLRVEHCI